MEEKIKERMILICFKEIEKNSLKHLKKYGIEVYYLRVIGEKSVK
jgi:hypothetical protein